MEQAQRNVAQGIFGRSLAENKVSDIKNEMLSIKSNLHDESHFVQQAIENAVKENAEHPNLSLAEAEVSKIEKTGKQLLTDVPKIEEIQKGLEDLGQDQLEQSLSNIDKKDQDLVGIQNGVKSALVEAKNHVKNYKAEQEKKKL